MVYTRVFTQRWNYAIIRKTQSRTTEQLHEMAICYVVKRRLLKPMSNDTAVLQVLQQFIRQFLVILTTCVCDFIIFILLVYSSL